MPLTWIAVLLVAILLVASWFYVERVRHPGHKPVAAYLIFVVAFSVTVAVVYGLLFSLIARLGAVSDVSLGVAVAVAVVVAVLVGRALVVRPPRSAPRL